MTGPSSERTADASDLMKQALDVPFTFDLLRDPEWQPTRENYAALRDAIAEVVARNQQLQEALAQGGNLWFDDFGREFLVGTGDKGARVFLTVDEARRVVKALTGWILQSQEASE